MKDWRLISTKSPIWLALGIIVFIVTICTTVLFVIYGSRPLKPISDVNIRDDVSSKGKLGTLTEPLGKGFLTLSYGTISGRKEDITLTEVSGQLQEPKAKWRLHVPLARKANDVWTLFGPVDLESIDARSKVILGKGHVDNVGPALRWDHGVWCGLSPVVWNDLDGTSHGKWFLPTGWYRDTSGKFIVDNGPVRWLSANKGQVVSMVAQKIWAAFELQEGHMENILVKLVDGQLEASKLDIDKSCIKLHGPISFMRSDGWHGDATNGYAPKVSNSSTLAMIELANFKARRALYEGTESISSDNVYWTQAGLVLKDNVVLEQFLKGKRMLLKAPTLLQRNNLGGNLPLDMPVGEIWAEPNAALFWDNQYLNSVRIKYISKTRQWQATSPVFGHYDDCTFTAGNGHGNPAYWKFDGPIKINFNNGLVANGNSLNWDNGTFNLIGKPITANYFQHRFTGYKLIDKVGILEFIDGVNAILGTVSGSVSIHADKGRIQQKLASLYGRVECYGTNWSMQANCISFLLDNKNVIRQLNASGSIFLRGCMGEGKGDTLAIDLNQKTVIWSGRVKTIVGVNS